MGTSFFWITLFLHKYYEVGAKTKKMTIFCTAYIIKMGVVTSLMVYLMFLAISRVYLGEHSFN